MKHVPITIFAFFSILTLFTSFVFNHDISGGGSTSDFETHWKYIKILNSYMVMVLMAIMLMHPTMQS